VNTEDQVALEQRVRRAVLKHTHPTHPGVVLLDSAWTNELVDVVMHAVDDANTDPLAKVSIFTEPNDEKERRRRGHARLFASIALDLGESNEERENAIRHMLICDPARGIGALIELHEHAIATAWL
jgi:hypothetical protein